MPDFSPPDRAQELRFECFGVAVAVAAESAEVLEAMTPALPPVRGSFSGRSVEASYVIRTPSPDEYEIIRDGSPLARPLALDHALDVLERDVRMTTALAAQDVIFVHAGAVGWRGRGIVVPGDSFSGKTTLVAALVEAGAVYFSDEYAVLDEGGRVHPYARPLSMRVDGVTHEKRTVERLGGTAGEEPLPVGALVLTKYREGAVWYPRPISGGEGVLALLRHAVPAQSRPEQTLRVLRRNADSSLCLSSERGEAAIAAIALLRELDGRWAG